VPEDWPPMTGSSFSAHLCAGEEKDSRRTSVALARARPETRDATIVEDIIFYTGMYKSVTGEARRQGESEQKAWLSK